MPPADSKVKKWLQWIDEQIASEVMTMNLHRDTFARVMRIAGEANLPKSYFWDYMRETYGMSQAVAIRRQAETKAGVRSLGRLIREVQGDAHRLTRDCWVSLWTSADDDVERAVAHRAFDEHFAGDVGDHFDPAVAAGDLAHLAAEAEAMRFYVNKYVAHADAHAPAETKLTFAEIDLAVDSIGTLFKKYSNLLTATAWPGLVPVLDHDWLAPFRVPWLKS